MSGCASVRQGHRRRTRGGRYCAGRYSVNVLPSPSVLCTRISPPSRRAISRLIDRPSPVPPYLRLVEPSACWNASKISLSLSGGIPMPVSVDREGDHRRPRWRGSRSRSASSGGAVAIGSVTRALLGELERVREQVLEDLLQPLLVGDDRASGVPSATLDLEVELLLARRPGGTCARRSRRRRSSDDVAPDCTSILPASTFDRSRMSLISVEQVGARRCGSSARTRPASRSRLLVVVVAPAASRGSAASSAACAARATCWPGTRTCTSS